MAKIKHHSSLDIVNEIILDAKKKGIVHLFTDTDEFNGRKLKIKGRKLLNFGTCGYLALEHDERVKQGAIESVKKYGTQFSVSRTYVTSGLNIELEEYLYKMYQYPVIIQSSTSTSHISNIPSLVREKDVIILDQQVHMSVQTASQLLRQKGVIIEMIRHSNLEMLERKIIELGNKFERIWYMIDGVYSMYGDVAPIKELTKLLEKYPQLYLYIDDAHGMSWYGKHGTGYIFDQVGISEKMILVTTLAKGFGVTGGITVFPNEESYQKVKIFGGPLTYSHPLAPPLLGAAIEAAKIHLSDEIYSIQTELIARISYCNELLDKSGLPVISDPLTPIYFIGMGQPRVGFNMVKRLIDDGFYVNVGLFPAVPAKCTGLRFTITRNQTLEDIGALVDALSYHFPRVLSEEKVSENSIRKAFKLSPIEEKVIASYTSTYTVQHETTIKNISADEWNPLLGQNPSLDWNGINFLEEAFSNNAKAEDNWKFHYYIIRNENNKPLLATFFTVGIYKDDMLAQETISRQIEEKRKIDPYYLTSLTVAMGSLLSLGEHLYIDRNYQLWRNVLTLLLEEATKLQENYNASAILLRDFNANDIELKDFLLSQGFVKIDMPNSNVVENMYWNNTEEFLEGLSTRNRRHIRYDVLKYEHYFDVEIKSKISEEEAEYFYKLYLNVKAKNFGVNYFPYPKNIVQAMSKHPNWEFIILKLKPEHDNRENKLPVAVMLCYKTSANYSPMLIGMDYDYLLSHKIYKQILFQVLKRARELDIEKVYFGLTADTEKKKYGAKQMPLVAYLQAKDNFNLEVIELMAAIEFEPTNTTKIRD